MPIPSLQLQKKTYHMQRSRGFCHGVVVSKICYNTVFVLSVVLCECCQPMNTCRDWAFSNSGLEVGLPSCWCSQNVTHCRKEICSTCLFKESIPTIPFGNSKHPTPTRSYCIMPIPSLQMENKIQSHAQKQRVWSLSCGLQDLLQSLSCALWLLQTNNSIVEIELLATVSWTCGCQPCSCPCSLNVMHYRKEIYATCLSKGIHAFCEHRRIQFLPEAWGRWERQHAPSALHDGCLLAKDRVEVSKIWITGHWLWSRLSYIRDCCKAMKECWDSGFSLRGLEAGLWAFRLQMLATSMEICWTRLSKASILALPFWNAKPPLPTRSLSFLRAAVPSSSSALWLHHAHPFVAAAGTNVSYAEKQRVWSRSCGTSMEDLLKYTDCAPMWLLQTKL